MPDSSEIEKIEYCSRGEHFPSSCKKEILPLANCKINKHEVNKHQERSSETIEDDDDNVVIE